MINANIHIPEVQQNLKRTNEKHTKLHVSQIFKNQKLKKIPEATHEIRNITYR